MSRWNEALLQFIWQQRLLKPVPLFTKSGSELVVLRQGVLNRNAGPDFSDAHIRINGLVLVGNIEIHLKTSDWLRHKHDRNRSYDTLILHVVYEHDLDLVQNTQHQVEVLELKELVDESVLEAYQGLMTNKNELACATQLKKVEEIKFLSWMERMTVERLEEKVRRIERLHEEFNGDYTQTVYSLLLRSFGFHVNALPFELISRQLPVHLLLKHADQLMQLEALLLGISGILETQFKDPYIQILQNEFEYLKNKYNLRPLKGGLFKFSKLRPANFPTLRLAQFANLVHTCPELITHPQAFNNYTGLKAALGGYPEGYWASHYRPDGNAAAQKLALGNNAVENIIINSFAPFFLFYSKKLVKPELADLAIHLLQQSRFEHNSKTRLFAAKAGCLSSAADSQGIINLFDNYCTKRQCLKCGIAAALLSSAKIQAKELV